MKWLISNKYLIATILLFSFIPLIGIQVYFRHDDSEMLLWASKFDKPFYYVFHPKIYLNQYATYETNWCYYRPFTHLYVMWMQDIFGNNPFFYHLIGSLMMISVVLLVYKMAETLTVQKSIAFMTMFLLLIFFYKIFYITYHIMTPFEYLLEMLCFYFGLIGIVKNKLRYLIIALLLLFPAATRQTGALIFVAMAFIYFSLHWKTVLPGKNITKVLILVLSLLPMFSLYFSSMTTAGSILTIPFSVSNYYQFLSERIDFYFNNFLRGVSGFFIFFVFLFYTGMTALKKWSVHFFNDQQRNISVVVLISLVWSLVMVIFLRQCSPYLLMTLLIFCFFVNRSTQLPIIWFFVSAGSFCAIDYYHWGYFFEAILAFVIVFGIISYEALERLNETYQINKLLNNNRKRLALILASMIAIITTAGTFKTGKIFLISNQIQSVKIFINTNKNFADIMDYMVQQFPDNAQVYEFSNETLNLTMWQSRFLSLVERAKNVKVMNIRDTRFMLKLLGRDDITLSPTTELMESNSNGAYFIACSRLEMKKAQQQYSLKLVKSFQRKYVEAAIYQLTSD